MAEDVSSGRFLEIAGTRLPAEEADLLGRLHQFTAARLAQARRLQADMEAHADAPEVHAFLRECWEALDGLAREVNLCMHHLFPGARLYPPLEMTRQCTFYMVRKLLREAPATADHPVAQLLWEETRGVRGGPYGRLSFLYNVSLFLPMPLPGGRLPGHEDLPEAALRLVRPQPQEGAPVAEGTSGIRDWLEGFAGECYAMLGEALARADGAIR